MRINMCINLYERKRGGNSQMTRTMKKFTGFVLMQMWNMLNARVLLTDKGVFSGIFSNRSFIGVMALILLLQFIIVQVFPGDVFRTVRIPGLAWVILVAATSLILAAGQLLRHLQNKTNNRQI